MQIRGDRIGHRTRHACQSSLVEHDFNALACPRTRSGIRQITLDEFHGIEADQVRPLPCDEVVDSAHVLAALDQFRGNGPPNEPRSAGYQVLRQFLPPPFDSRLIQRSGQQSIGYKNRFRAAVSVATADVCLNTL